MSLSNLKVLTAAVCQVLLSTGVCPALPPSIVVGASSRMYWCHPSCLGLSVRVVETPA